MYKTITKTLNNRNKHVLEKVISMSQSAFVRERLTTDNVIASFGLMPIF